MIWLGIDTANTPISIALVQDQRVITEENTTTAVNHSLRAMTAIEAAFKRADIQPHEVDGIVVAQGPGSYTGVRIGVTIAKTLAWTLKKPLVGVSSLQSLATNALYFRGLICPLIDARRNHVYAGLYQQEKGQLQNVLEDQHISIDNLIEALHAFDGPILFVGPDLEKFQAQLTEGLQDKVMIAPFQMNLPKASSLIYAGQEMKPMEETHHFVPEYKRIAEAEANWLKANQKES